MLNESLTRMLATYNKFRLEPGNDLLPHPHEIGYVEIVRDIVKPMLPTQFTMSWFEDLLYHGPGQGDPLFTYLANDATMDEMKWFLSQEAAGEAGFDDLVAMTQVKMPTRAKLEMARNYWDEMGQGSEKLMHGKMLDGVVGYLELAPTMEGTVSESLQLANLMVAMAVHRRYAFLAVGALGAIEMTAPSRVTLVDKGLARLGVPKSARRYFTLHGTLDVKHSREWNREVIKSLGPDRLPEICEGAYIRLWAGSQCFERYRSELGIQLPKV